MTYLLQTIFPTPRPLVSTSNIVWLVDPNASGCPDDDTPPGRRVAPPRQVEPGMPMAKGAPKKPTEPTGPEGPRPRTNHPYPPHIDIPGIPPMWSPNIDIADMPPLRTPDDAQPAAGPSVTLRTIGAHGAARRVRAGSATRSPQEWPTSIPAVRHRRRSRPHPC